MTLKTRYLQKKIYNADTKSLIFQGYTKVVLPNVQSYNMSFYIKQF